MASLASLPLELVVAVCEFLDFGDIRALLATCRHTRHAALLASVWRRATVTLSAPSRHLPASHLARVLAQLPFERLDARGVAHPLALVHELSALRVQRLAHLGLSVAALVEEAEPRELPHDVAEGLIELTAEWGDGEGSAAALLVGLCSMMRRLERMALQRVLAPAARADALALLRAVGHRLESLTLEESMCGLLLGHAASSDLRFLRHLSLVACPVAEDEHVTPAMLQDIEALHSLTIVRTDLVRVLFGARGVAELCTRSLVSLRTLQLVSVPAASVALPVLAAQLPNLERLSVRACSLPHIGDLVFSSASLCSLRFAACGTLSWAQQSDLPASLRQLDLTKSAIPSAELEDLLRRAPAGVRLIGRVVARRRDVGVASGGSAAQERLALRLRGRTAAAAGK